jgi:hypothetical protein
VSLSNTKKCTNCYDRNLLVECKCGCHSIITERDDNSRLHTYKHGHRNRQKYPNPIIQGSDHYNWNGGRWLTSRGYVHVSTGHHKHKQEHIIIMEKHLDRKLMPNELVHHKNGIKDDNRLENLELLTRQTHPPIHNKRNPLNGRFIT